MAVITEWLDVSKTAEERIPQLHMQRYDWASQHVKGPKIANAACGTNYGAFFFEGRSVTGFDRCPLALGCAERDGFVPIVQCDITTQRFEGFDALVSMETLEHLPDPWMWLGQVSADVKEFAASVPIIPTKHYNPYHLHDFTSAEFVMNVVDLGWRIQQMWQQCNDVLCIYATRR